MFNIFFFQKIFIKKQQNLLRGKLQQNRFFQNQQFRAGPRNLPEQQQHHCELHRGNVEREFADRDERRVRPDNLSEGNRVRGDKAEEAPGHRAKGDRVEERLLLGRHLLLRQRRRRLFLEQEIRLQRHFAADHSRGT